MIRSIALFGVMFYAGMSFGEACNTLGEASYRFEKADGQIVNEVTVCNLQPNQFFTVTNATDGQREAHVMENACLQIEVTLAPHGPEALAQSFELSQNVLQSSTVVCFKPRYAPTSGD